MTRMHSKCTLEQENYYACMQVVGVAAIALGSYVVHIARTEGGIGVVLAGGALLIVGGIIVVLVTSAGIYGAVSLSKIMLGIVSLMTQKILLAMLKG